MLTNAISQQRNALAWTNAVKEYFPDDQCAASQNHTRGNIRLKEWVLMPQEEKLSMGFDYLL